MASQLPEIAQALLNPSIYPEKPAGVEIMQTQMSFIFLSGKYVYKLKKPVNLGFLDYTTLEKRRFFCEQEVELNRRLCPQVYLGVLRVTREKSGLALEGPGETVDYVVKMLYLPQDRMLNVLLDRNRVQPEMLEKVAQIIAEFHSRAATNPTISSFGQLPAVKVNTDENFSQTRPYIGRIVTPGQFERLKAYNEAFFTQSSDLFNQRVADGKIRDCHGDLHTQHICFSDNIYIYDCIEFNERFRYCDVASEIAFLAMDLEHYGRADLSRAFVKGYISASGDRQIKELLKFYKIYRAHVRGKVGCFKFDDPYISESERKQTLEAARSYFELADSYAYSRPRLFITVGLVGSGKSTVSQIIAKRLGLTVLSSDIIRKQLADIAPTEHRFEEMDSGIYSAEFSQKTYAKMYLEAEAILKDGDSVILDATFLSAEERKKGAALAKIAGADFFVIECHLDEANTRQRLSQRLKNTAVSDGRWEIYEPQKRKFEPVNEFPAEMVFTIDSAHNIAEQVSGIITHISD
jgi:aminoglycoside phosphotransferase family enzyme/predicted kinase